MASPQLHGLNRGRHSPEWTPEMRDRQARGKDPNKEEEEPPRNKADDSEVLKIGGRQSVTGQRVRFLRQLCGYDEDRDRQQIHPMRPTKGQQYDGGRGGR
ncbi:hypothetical protein Neosp_011183 [[Neocosmospora] mangrovei]